ncbi:hypothetical protein BCIN_12g02420 [Botrytis cinerea B05.10]|uniref:F-box domain-containing protein n=1 Tax=Botryotinia fuckeliana (strain B05.10) TaxID=332648 RepID=A0A384JYM9_BOTFB|nr:hypothetical protein BCIN_12g02420 [Botrytis cinerea B05.10]ATZ55673.1 hypothetical protein BCIN_12g02420 [Botrytis cinerea B05.10]
MTNLNKANSFPLLKGSIDLLLLLPQYLDTIEDFIHLSSTCKTLYDIYTEHTPLPGLVFELAAASSLEIFEPKPHFLISGVARQIGEWAIETSENRTEFHESFKTEGIFGLFELCKKRGEMTVEEIRSLVDRKSILRSLVLIHSKRNNRTVYSEYTAMLPYLQIAMFGGLFAASVSNFCEPGVTNPLHTKIRLDWWAKCCPDRSCNDSLELIGSQPPWLGGRQMYAIMEALQNTASIQTPTLISLMRSIPECFVTSADECRKFSYDNTYHDRNLALSAFVYLQGWDSLDLMYQVEVGKKSLHAQAAVDAAMIAFRMDTSQVAKFKVISDGVKDDLCEDLGTVVSIELDTRFVCDRGLLKTMLYSILGH